jgi:hypothetical protein
MKFINLTHHVINEVTTGVTFQPSGTVARVSSFVEETGEMVNGIKFFKTSFGEVTGLPEPQEDVIYIVSGMVLDTLGGSRPDVVAPCVLTRNGAGQPIGCEGFRK